MKQFQAFRLDPVNHRLWHDDDRVTLAPKAFDVLRYLVQHADRLVTQEEILEAIWPDTHVNPEVIKKYVLEIRKVLGDRSDRPMFIETFPRRGYQFVAPVSEANADMSAGLPVRSATMVGRDGSQALLERSLESVLQGQRQVVFVTGEPGVGKTTLADAFQRRAAVRASLRMARGQCVEGFGGKESYYPILEALGQLLRETHHNPLIPALARFAPTWLVQFPSLQKGETREALHRETIGTTRERMVREICEALEAITIEDPLVLVLEDLHWVDLSTLDVISALARRRGPAKLMLLCTYRPADVVEADNPLKVLKQDLLIHRLCTELALEHLEGSDVADYLRAEFPGADLPSGLAGLIHRQSGGNALFMTAIVRDMVDRAMIVKDGGRWAMTGALADVALGVPATLQQMLEAQFSRLSAIQQSVLSRASVAGERFSVWSLTTPELTTDEIENACEVLAERHQFIKAAGFQELADGTVSAHYEFRHALYREAVYRHLSEVGRSRLHRLLGERLKVLCWPGRQELAAELALHFEKGREYDLAIGYLILAAENAAARFAYRDSVRVLQHALTLLPRVAAERQADLEIQLLERIGDAHYWLGAMVECARAYEAEAARAAQAGLLSARVTALSFLIRPFGLIDPDRGIAAIEEAVALSAGLSDPLLRGRTELLAAGSKLLYDTWRREDWEMCESARQRLQELSPAGLPDYHQMIYAHLLMLQGHYAKALASLEAGIPKPNEPTSLMVHLFALSGKTVALLHSGQLGELLRILRAGREMAEKNGNDPWIFVFREAWLRSIVLDFDGARRLCDAVADPATGYLARQPQTIARLAAAYVELERGRHDDASRYFEQILDPAITPKFFLHWYWRMNAQLGLSNVWLAAGRVSRARSDADRFLASALATAEPNLHALGWDVQARVSMAEKDWKAAEAYIEHGLVVLERFDVPTVAWRLHATRSELYRRLKNDEAAEAHRARAESVILTLANSFDGDEPLRHTFLAAAPIRRILRTPPARQKRTASSSRSISSATARAFR
jgi:DNA-binding winged helix-turn-helix (wHTH) protein/tetratricopeptide (TPR) repeat protein